MTVSHKNKIEIERKIDAYRDRDRDRDRDTESQKDRCEATRVDSKHGPTTKHVVQQTFKVLRGGFLLIPWDSLESTPLLVCYIESGNRTALSA